MNTQENNHSEPEQNNSPELETYLQTDINKGQARINFELNQVDKDVINALHAIVTILKTVKALPPLKDHLKAIDFSAIDKALSDACDRSQKVADIRPPGCLGPGPYPE